MQVHQLSLTQIAELIRARELSPVEVLCAHLDRIEQFNPKLNAFIGLRVEAAMREAQAAEAAAKRREKLGPLHGVPISIKSAIAVAGLKHECGSRNRAGIVAQRDAVLVQRLKNAGAIILGNTNVPEMLMAYETENPLYGRTNSPWDLQRTPGGSSGGEAAAIAAGLCCGGIGSDGGGSIRVPAHFTGICGLKPTPGRIPATGHWPESLGPFALLGVVGPMARTVADVELMFRATAGFDVGDAMASPIPLRDDHDDLLFGSTAETQHAASLPRGQRDSINTGTLTVGYFEEHPNAPVTADTRAAVQKAATALKNAGVRVQPFRCDLLGDARDHWWTLFVRLAGEMLAPEFIGREVETGTILTYSDRPPSKEELLSAWFERDRLRLCLAKQMSEVQVILCPVCSVPAFHHGEREWNIGGKCVSYMDAMRYTQWFNLLGNPALVLPVGSSAEGLPIGVQIVGQPNSEELILKVGRVLEQRLDPYRLAPMMLASSVAAAQSALQAATSRS